MTQDLCASVAEQKQYSFPSTKREPTTRNSVGVS